MVSRISSGGACQLVRVLVTGAAGFIGQALVPSLRAEGFEPILLLEAGGSSHPSSGDNKPANSALGTNYQGDLRNRRQIAEIVKACRPQKVIHLAAVGVTDPFLDYYTAVENNVMGTLNLLHACFDADDDLPAVEQLIITRTPGEASMMNVYAASKAAAWAFCSMYTKTRAWPIIGASIYQAYGPGQSKKA